MQLIFLDKSNLLYKDYGYVDADFELVIDLVISQKSTFNVNKININADIGDLVVLKECNYSYVGIIETINVSEDGKSKIQTNDFKEIFNVKVPIESFSGDLVAYLSSIINRYFINSGDSIQDLPYLTISKETEVNGSLVFGDDNLITVTELIELVSKTYEINIKYNVGFIRGRFSGIELIIYKATTGIKMKSNLSAISDLSISDSDEQVTNKVIFYPKKENTEHNEVIAYCLLTDGTISTNIFDEKRYSNVVLSYSCYSDSDYETLATTARSEMVSSNIDHSITFTLASSNSIFKPLNNLFVGDYIGFFTDKKSYSTVISQIKYKSNFSQCYITLGEYRTRLTDKIKILTKNVNSSIGKVAISNAGTTNLDGGEF